MVECIAADGDLKAPMIALMDYELKRSIQSRASVLREFRRSNGKIVKTRPTGRASQATLGSSSVLRYV